MKVEKQLMPVRRYSSIHRIVTGHHLRKGTAAGSQAAAYTFLKHSFSYVGVFHHGYDNRSAG